MSKAKYLLLALIITALAGLPLIIKSPYLIHILILTAFYVSLVLSYNLSLGEVGTLSLAHAAFYGVGGYVAALLSTRVGWSLPLVVELLLAGLVAGVLALVIGVTCFRLPARSFAIGTLAFALITQQVVQNWVSLTRGPMCIVPIPAPRLGLPFLSTGPIASLSQYYYLALVVALLVLAFCYRLTNSRIGRAFVAVRESETLARSVGINPLKYKMLALVIGATIAGMIGACYAHYAQIICPTDLSFAVTTNLLIMVYVGGVGSLRGIILGAIAFTFLPELLRLAPQIRLLLYGVILLLTTLYMPQGLEGAIARVFKRR